LAIADGQRSFSYWLIMRRAGGRVEALTTRATGPGEALPVFGFEEEAQMFIHLAALGAAWRARRTAAGEIVSLLYGPCSSVAGVVLDPVPGFGSDVPFHTSFGGREFVAFLSEQQKAYFSIEKTVWAGRFPTPVDRAPGDPAEAV
jgi:hypothetical protein